MSQKFDFLSCKATLLPTEEGGGRVTLQFAVPNLPALLNESLPHSAGIADELRHEIDEALAPETAATRALKAAGTELNEAEARVATLTARLPAAETGRADAVERGDLAAADALSMELSQLPAQLHNAEQRLRRLRQDALVYEAETAVANERAATEARIRDEKRLELESALRDAERQLALAVERAFVEWVEASSAVAACDAGWQSTKRLHPWSAAQRAAYEADLLSRNRAAGEEAFAERRAREAAQNAEADRRATLRNQYAEMERLQPGYNAFKHLKGH